MLLCLAAHVGALKEAGGAPESTLLPRVDGVAQQLLAQHQQWPPQENKLRGLKEQLTRNTLRKRVFLICGQSNVNGYGRTADLPAALKKRLQAVEGRVAVVNSACNGEDGVLPGATRGPEGSCPIFQSVVNGRTSQNVTGARCFGPEMKMGLRLAEAYPNDRIIISKSYISASRLAWELSDDGTLYSTGSCARGLSALRMVTDQPPEAVGTL